jgi:hypothetical protein
MWNKDYKEVKEVITKKGSKWFPEFEIDFNKLAELTNNYEEFLTKVKENYEEHKDSFHNITVYRDVTDTKECVYVVFDHHDTYVRLYGCDKNYEKHPFIWEFSQNKTFVSMMANSL